MIDEPEKLKAKQMRERFISEMPGGSTDLTTKKP